MGQQPENIGGMKMSEESRIALLGIIVENTESVEAINALLHEYGDLVVGRMGIPYRSHGVFIISIVLDAPQSVVSALAGKLGMLPGVNVNTIYSKNRGC